MGTDDNDILGDDEFVHRRISVAAGFYQPDTAYLSSKAFTANRNDITGTSYFSARHNTAEQAGQTGRQGGKFFVATFRVGDIRSLGVDVTSAPLPGLIGHCEIQEMKWDKGSRSHAELAQALVNLTPMISGPFDGTA